MKQSLSIFLQDRRFGACLSLKTNLAISSLSSADKTTVFRGLFLEGGGDLISLFSRKEHTCQKATSSFDIRYSTFDIPYPLFNILRLHHSLFLVHRFIILTNFIIRHSLFVIHHSPGTTTEKTAHPFFDPSIPVALLQAKDHPNQK